MNRMLLRMISRTYDILVSSWWVARKWRRKVMAAQKATWTWKLELRVRTDWRREREILLPKVAYFPRRGRPAIPWTWMGNVWNFRCNTRQQRLSGLQQDWNFVVKMISSVAWIQLARDTGTGAVTRTLLSPFWKARDGGLEQTSISKLHLRYRSIWGTFDIVYKNFDIKVCGFEIRCRSIGFDIEV